MGMNEALHSAAPCNKVLRTKHWTELKCPHNHLERAYRNTLLTEFKDVVE
jgi:hypothetical protein